MVDSWNFLAAIKQNICDFFEITQIITLRLTLEIKVGDITPFQVKGSKLFVIEPPFYKKVQNILSLLDVQSSLICIFYIPE